MAKTARKKQQPEVSEETQPVEVVTENNVPQDQPENKDAGQQQPPPTDTQQPGQPAPPAAQPPVTLEIVQARFKVELTKFSYEAGLQAISNYKVTEDNIADAQERLKAARKLLTKFDDIKDVFKRPVLERGRMIDAAYNSLKQPLQEQIAKLQTDLNNIAKEQERKRLEQEKETKRVDGIKKDMDDTLMAHSQAIAAADKTETLVAIEKMIGSQKANKTRFMEFLPEFIERAGELTPLIKKQKDALKELELIASQQAEAEAKGDDGAFIELEAKKELVTARIEETQVVVQEKAINQATAVNTTTEVGRPVFNTIKSRRSTWKAELPKNQKDLEKAFKSGLLTCDLDREKIKTLIATLEDTGQLKDIEEITVNGVRIYLEKLF